ncbi:uncharacterized protein PRCAT00002074001 [Priceomyces carsonii]|uniref:uncharacterized protein n=1 Tax=Priceomyces carsonii TaxID=28549 RepID=UPI002EDA4465|nr:unnamed protein product [Priceomyces carsonii]
MSLITNKQQALIDLAIASYITAYDKISLQYLNLRTEVFELNLKIEKQLVAKEPIPSENQIKALKLEYELDKQEEIFKLHMSSWSKSLDVREKFSPPYYEQLQEKFDELKLRKETLEKDINRIKEVQKPTLNDMSALAKSFDVHLSSKRAKRFNKTSIQKFLNSNTGAREKSKQIDTNNLVFSKEQIDSLFTDVDLTSIDVLRYVRNQMQNGRTLTELDDDRYLYDVSKSILHGTDSGPNIAEFDNMIEDLTSNIKDLINQGSVAKERWSENSRKLAAISQTLEDIQAGDEGTIDQEMKD